MESLTWRSGLFSGLFGPAGEFACEAGRLQQSIRCEMSMSIDDGSRSDHVPDSREISTPKGEEPTYSGGDCQSDEWQAGGPAQFMSECQRDSHASAKAFVSIPYRCDPRRQALAAENQGKWPHQSWKTPPLHPLLYTKTQTPSIWRSLTTGRLGGRTTLRWRAFWKSFRKLLVDKLYCDRPCRMNGRSSGSTGRLVTISEDIDTAVEKLRAYISMIRARHNPSLGRKLFHCRDQEGESIYPIIPEGLGMIAESSGLRGRPEGAQRLKAGPEGPMIPRVMPSPEGMIRVHSDPHRNKEENKINLQKVESNRTAAKRFKR